MEIGTGSILLILLSELSLLTHGSNDKEAETPEEEMYGVKYASECEGAKFLNVYQYFNLVR